MYTKGQTDLFQHTPEKIHFVGVQNIKSIIETKLLITWIDGTLKLLFLFQTKCCSYSLESSQPDGSNEYPQHRIWSTVLAVLFFEITFLLLKWSLIHYILTLMQNFTHLNTHHFETTIINLTKYWLIVWCLTMFSIVIQCSKCTYSCFLVFFLPMRHTIFFPSHCLLSHITIVKTIDSSEREEWILLHWLSSILGNKISQTADQTSNLLFSGPVFYTAKQTGPIIFHRFCFNGFKGLSTDWSIVWCLLLFSTIFQSYHSSQRTYPCFPTVFLTSCPHNIFSKQQSAFPH